jgi:hypothetical protein
VLKTVEDHSVPSTGWLLDDLLKPELKLFFDLEKEKSPLAVFDLVFG